MSDVGKGLSSPFKSNDCMDIRIQACFLLSSPGPAQLMLHMLQSQCYAGPTVLISKADSWGHWQQIGAQTSKHCTDQMLLHSMHDACIAERLGKPCAFWIFAATAHDQLWHLRQQSEEKKRLRPGGRYERVPGTVWLRRSPWSQTWFAAIPVALCRPCGWSIPQA